MKAYFILVLFSAVLADNIENVSKNNKYLTRLLPEEVAEQTDVTAPLEDSIEFSRDKKNAAGALHIVTNHAQPIHADIKPEGTTDITEKPCINKHLASQIEPGVVFQVIPPNDALYEKKSLRKSLPLTNKFDIIRSVTRVATLLVLVVSAILEFYPMLQFLYYIAYSFIYLK